MRTLLQTTTRYRCLAATGWLALGLAGCAGGATKDVAEVAGLATTTQEPKVFVQQSRRADGDYIPVGRRFAQPALCKTANSPPPGPTTAKGRIGTFILGPPEAPDSCKPAAKFQTIEAQLEARRRSNEAAASQAKQLGATQPPLAGKLTN